MSYKEDFSRLETLVEKLLAQVDALRRQNGELQAALDSRGLELDKMQNEIREPAGGKKRYTYPGQQPYLFHRSMGRRAGRKR